MRSVSSIWYPTCPAERTVKDIAAGYWTPCPGASGLLGTIYVVQPCRYCISSPSPLVSKGRDKGEAVNRHCPPRVSVLGGSGDGLFQVLSKIPFPAV